MQALTIQNIKTPLKYIHVAEFNSEQLKWRALVNLATIICDLTNFDWATISMPRHHETELGLEALLEEKVQCHNNFSVTKRHFM